MSDDDAKATPKQQQSTNSRCWMDDDGNIRIASVRNQVHERTEPEVPLSFGNRKERRAEKARRRTP